MRTDEDNIFMLEALQEAKLAFSEGEVPVGAIIVKEGKIIGRGHNEKEEKHDVTSHAEIEAIRQAEQALGSWSLSGATLYVTLEPCIMCAGAIVQSRISRLVYGAEDPDRGAIVHALQSFEIFKKDNDPLVTRGVLQQECEDLLNRFFAEQRKR